MKVMIVKSHIDPSIIDWLLQLVSDSVAASKTIMHGYKIYIMRVGIVSDSSERNNRIRFLLDS